ncbi:hypothetical protein [Rathayibacter sp. VKM Ac-2801]|uniref:hypothetical protein n=1 Tax=Rathayibacter sp. VKM Ac-2801 TaxID=2609255 RepID=UPI00131FDE1A|nr:hypothetical protein [Rathayibacter sp. VKM Ac-2801]QHC69359.1 hypothetical protein GSU45_02475 [Rathayibacter sp. VKM Ac-2801]
MAAGFRGGRSSSEVRLTQWKWFSRAGAPTERVLIGVSLVAIVGGNLVFDALNPDAVPLAARLAVLVGAFIVLTVLPLVVHAIRRPAPYADLSAKTVRVRSRVTPFASFTTARRIETGRSKQVVLEVSAPGEKVLLELRDRLGRVTTDPTQDAIVTFLQGSRVAMPSSSEDPTGRFAHVNFPQHLTREQAIELASHPLTSPDIGAGHHDVEAPSRGESTIG